MKIIAAAALIGTAMALVAGCGGKPAGCDAAAASVAMSDKANAAMLTAKDSSTGATATDVDAFVTSKRAAADLAAAGIPSAQDESLRSALVGWADAMRVTAAATTTGTSSESVKDEFIAAMVTFKNVCGVG